MSIMATYLAIHPIEERQQARENAPEDLKGQAFWHDIGRGDTPILNVDDEWVLHTIRSYHAR